ncbi:glycosyltransferase family 2 protein [Spirulina major CS-329]|uniref:2'-O-glycosyltransferase CruG n=1 Tax=Spirulina TaxID=1154 RepID=UPI00232EC8FD|nr:MULTISPECIES: glycosyltransferase family 2 protein [Spirulina]MDB9495768.1 glycosyltransferase family 2 protein [Spirulina subsalsa CS-330]MDB9503216.1 glycosyltransferase family 2 protein [Spirulina major CS-329]
MTEAIPFYSAIALGYLLLTVPMIALLMARLLKGPQRRPPVAPCPAQPHQVGAVSVIVPTLNEAERIGPCLAGLSRQTYELREVVVVDSRSTDGTAALVETQSKTDPRFRVITDDPLPAAWVGRPWALDYGFRHSSPRSPWVLGIDADTQPQPGLIAGLLQIAETEGYDLISLSPQFILRDPGEWWLQPALLMTLLYRFDPSGSDASHPERVMANGQCFLCRRSVLAAMDGYQVARRSFCDDVTLAREIAKRGYRVGFLDGQRVIRVRMYDGMAETWREWGRSLDLKDAATPGQVWSDCWFLLVTQGLPLVVSLLAGVAWLSGVQTLPIAIAGFVNAALVAIRWALLGAIAPSYAGKKPLWFWLSPLADLAAVTRIILSAQQQPQVWRGRQYDI